MADTPQTLALILTSLAQLYRPKIVRQLNRRSVLLRSIRITPGIGKNVAWDVEGGNGATDQVVVENFSDGADVTNFGSDALAPASLSWGLVRANFRVTDLAAAAAMATRNPTDLIKLLGRNIQNATMALASQINGQLFTGSGAGGQINGLLTAVVGAVRDDNTYATINRLAAANAFWKATVKDAAGAPLTQDMLRYMIGDAIYTASGESPDLAFVNPAGFNKIGLLFQNQRRYNQTADGGTVISTARGEVKLDASVGAISVDGCTFIKDKDMTAGQIVFLNSEYVEGEYLPQQPEEEFPETMLEAAADDGYGPMPLGFRVVQLARLGASRKFSLQAFIQLKVTRPNACGWLYGYT